MNLRPRVTKQTFEQKTKQKKKLKKNTSRGSESAESHPYLTDVAYYSFFTNDNIHCMDRN